MHFPFNTAIGVFWVKAYLTVFGLVLIFKPETDLRNTFAAYSKDALFIVICQNKES